MAVLSQIYYDIDACKEEFIANSWTPAKSAAGLRREWGSFGLWVPPNFTPFIHQGVNWVLIWCKSGPNEV